MKRMRKPAHNMLKVYASKTVERRILAVLAEFRCRTFTSYAIPHVTRKKRKTRSYQVVNYPIN